jgi:lactate racemase
VHFALNSVVNESKQIVSVLAGDPREVMRRGIPIVLELYQARVNEPFDLMIASPGGHPKDINLYQAQKALAHATFVTKENGTVILCAACPEGTGSAHFDEWMADKLSHAQVIDTFRREGYRLGPHKAFLISRDAIRERVLFVTDMRPELARRLLLNPSPAMSNALSIGLSGLPPNARIGIMPFANATIPVLTTDHRK